MDERIFGIRVNKKGFVPGILKTGPFQTRLGIETIIKIGLGLKNFSDGETSAMIMLGDTEAVYLTEEIIFFLRNNPKATKEEIMAAGVVVDGLEPSVPLPSIKDLIMTIDGAVEVLKPFKILVSSESCDAPTLDKIVSELTYDFNPSRFEKIDNTTFKALVAGQGIIVAKHKRLVADIPISVTANVVPTSISIINDTVFNNAKVGDKINFAIEILDAQGNDIVPGIDDVTITVSETVTATKVSASSYTLTCVTEGATAISLAYKGLSLEHSFTIAAVEQIVAEEGETVEPVKEPKKK